MMAHKPRTLLAAYRDRTPRQLALRPGPVRCGVTLPVMSRTSSGASGRTITPRFESTRTKRLPAAADPTAVVFDSAFARRIDRAMSVTEESESVAGLPGTCRGHCTCPT